MVAKWFKQKAPKAAKKSTDGVKTAVVQAVGRFAVAPKSPDEIFGELFDAVQLEQIYEDGKIFADLVPRKRAKALSKEFNLSRQDPNFDLSEFVKRHFYELHTPEHKSYTPSAKVSAREHVRNLWPALTRRNRKDRGSLLALPYPYIVPGGRFSEQFYWDNYFIMLGLARDGHWALIHGMIKNYAYMISKFGKVPTANRSYFLSRSQPPMLAEMIDLLSGHRGKTRTYVEFLPYLLTEYNFWMKGRKKLKDDPTLATYLRVAKLPGGVVMNRYFDDKLTPRPESRREDIETADLSLVTDKTKVFLDLRAGAESGWDFSSRWFDDPQDIKTIQTTDVVPVDLNCLLYKLEILIAKSYRLIKQGRLAKRFEMAARQRAEVIRYFMWNNDENFFADFDLTVGKVSSKATLAMVYPLYARIATDEQARCVAEILGNKFLKAGGLVTTLEDTGQQWDAPNGWAPLQWVAIQGLRHYGYDKLADEIRDRWLSLNEKVYGDLRKMVEKYDVVKFDVGSGGEYTVQDGFGWTNGVYAVLKDEQLSKINRAR